MHGKHQTSCGCGCGHHDEDADHSRRLAPSRDWSQVSDEETVCYCQSTSKGALLEAIRQGAYTLPLLKTMTGAGRGRQCKQRHPEERGCEADLEELIRLYAQGPALERAGGCGH
jgi:acyl CoA:acetate/3-ketoacid CoA transferase alpha subunit